MESCGASIAARCASASDDGGQVGVWTPTRARRRSDDPACRDQPPAALGSDCNRLAAGIEAMAPDRFLRPQQAAVVRPRLEFPRSGCATRGRHRRGIRREACSRAGQPPPRGTRSTEFSSASASHRVPLRHGRIRCWCGTDAAAGGGRRWRRPASSVNRSNGRSAVLLTASATAPPTGASPRPPRSSVPATADSPGWSGGVGVKDHPGAIGRRCTTTSRWHPPRGRGRRWRRRRGRQAGRPHGIGARIGRGRHGRQGYRVVARSGPAWCRGTF